MKIKKPWKATTLILGLMAVLGMLALTGCEHPLFGDEVEFNFVVTNRVYVTVEVYLDGEYLGEVGPASTAKFTRDIQVEKGSPVYSSSERSFAYVTMSAKTVVLPPARQSISRSVSFYIYNDRTNEIEFNYWDFDQAIRTGWLEFDFAVNNHTDELIMVSLNGDTLIDLLESQTTNAQANVRLECFWIANDGIGSAKAIFTATAYYRDGSKKLSRAKEMTVYNNKITVVTFSPNDFLP